MATDDAHGYHAFGVGKVNPGRGWIMVKAPYLTAEAIVRGNGGGRFLLLHRRGLQGRWLQGRSEFSLVIRAEDGVKYKTQFIATMRDAPLAFEPRKDGDGKALDVTRSYNADIGKVVAESDSLDAELPLHGQGTLCAGEGDLDQAASEPVSEGGRGGRLDAAGRH